MRGSWFKLYPEVKKTQCLECETNMYGMCGRLCVLHSFWWGVCPATLSGIVQTLQYFNIYLSNILYYASLHLCQNTVLVNTVSVTIFECFCIFSGLVLYFEVLVSSLFSFLWVQCHFLFPSVPSVSGFTPIHSVNSSQVFQFSNHSLHSI